jgi:hypothetical protein
MTIQILKRDPELAKFNKKINNSNVSINKNKTLSERCENYNNTRSKIFGNNYKPNNDMKELEEAVKNDLEDEFYRTLHISIEEWNDIYNTYTQLLNNFNIINSRREKHTIDNILSDYVLIKNLENIFRKIMDKNNRKRKQSNSGDDENEYEESSDTSVYKTNNDHNTITTAKKSKKNKSDMEKKEDEIKILEKELSTTKEQSKRIMIEQKILSAKQLIEAISICNTHKEEKKKLKAIKSSSLISTTTIHTRNSIAQINNNLNTNNIDNQTNKSNNNIKLNAQTNNIKNLLTRIELRQEQQQSENNQFNNIINNKMAPTKPTTSGKSTGRQVINNNNKQLGEDTNNNNNNGGNNNNNNNNNNGGNNNNNNRRVVNGNNNSTHQNINENEISKKKGLIKAAHNANAMKFESKSFAKFVNGKNSYELKERIRQFCGDIMVGHACYEKKQDEATLNQTKMYILKIFMYDEDDYLELDKKDHMTLFDGNEGKRVSNKIPLIAHTILSTKICLENKNLQKTLHDEYGIISTKRMISNKPGETKNQIYTSVKLEVNDLENWKKVLTNGIYIDSSRLSIVTEWKKEPIFCKKCLTYKHRLENCPDNNIYCEICTILLDNHDSEHECIQKCKYCNKETHQTNSKSCIKYQNEKEIANKNYQKLIELLEIKKSKYNIKRNQIDKVNTNQDDLSKLKHELEEKINKLEDTYTANENKRTADKKELIVMINNLKESQNQSIKKIKDKLNTTERNFKINNIRNKYLTDYLLKDAKLKERMEEEIVEIENNKMSDDEDGEDETNGVMQQDNEEEDEC